MRMIAPSLAIGAALLALPGIAAAQSAPDPVAAEGDQLIERMWKAHLRECGNSAFKQLDDRVVIQLEEPKFHLAPTDLKPPAIQNGYSYQKTAIASAKRWRWAPLTPSGPLKWTPWQEGETITVRFDQTAADRRRTTVYNAVLQFDLVRKDGEWKANRPLSPLNADYRPFDISGSAPVDRLPACERLQR